MIRAALQFRVVTAHRKRLFCCKKRNKRGQKSGFGQQVLAYKIIIYYFLSWLLLSFSHLHRRLSTYGYVDESLSAWPRHANTVTRLEVSIDINVKDGLSRLFFYITEVF